nr:uncharacterized protein LOC111502940 [Leptinotarsa decemlineata]
MKSGKNVTVRDLSILVCLPKIHTNTPNKLSQKTTELVNQHIASFKGRASHYSLADSRKTYLPEDLNLKKMFGMFKQLHPDCSTISYESYRTIFNGNFNISFGYPRTDTCSTCDQYLSKIKSLEHELSSTNVADEQKRLKTTTEIRNSNTENMVHKARAQEFYNRKKRSKFASRKDKSQESICMDFGKKFPLPNISTNDVYYKRQLSIYLFNIHTLSTSESVFYVYPESIGKKGSDDICSLLFNFLYNQLDPQVRKLEIFCDSCGGQNKNYTVFRFLHHVIQYQKRLDYVKVTFPIRRHSYMENDKNMGLINTKARVETLEEMCELLQSSRCKPSPFVVVKINEQNQTIFRQWSQQLTALYQKKKCPFPTRPIRELEITKEHPRLMRYRCSFNGMWETAILTEKKQSRSACSDV